MKKMLAVGLGASLLLLASVSAAAKGPALHHHKGRTLVMTTRNGKLVFRGRVRRTARLGSDPSAIVSFQGFRCEATVGTGGDDNTPTNMITHDSVEFYFSFSEGADTFDTVTTNCDGTLPPGTVHATTIVSHSVACRQFNPFSMSATTIQGYGISTTYPDGIFSETCNTPNFSH